MKNTPKNMLQAKLGKATESPTPEQEAEPVEIGHEYGHEYTFEQSDQPDGLYWRIVGDRPIKLISGSTLDTSATRLPAPAPLPNPPAARVRRLSGKECIRDVFEPRRDELSAMNITDAGKVLAKASNLKVGSCINLLRATGAWKKQPRGQLNPRRPRSK